MHDYESYLKADIGALTKWTKYDLELCFKKLCISGKQCKVQTLFLLNSVQYQEMSHQDSLILECFHPRGKQGQSAKKHKCVFYSHVHCCQHDSIMLGPKEWHREREHANNCIQGFLQTNTMSLAALFSREPRRQIDTPNLGVEEEALTMELTV